ncbi:MAG: zinc-dependent dehydrogenase [Candidatus Bathyarchaeota archaeon]|nr:MAG: zinc-dependent dehydrogenase [Candidatus Bathyarchaeota archaeon]
MKAAIYYSPEKIQIEDIPRPKISPDEILVEMKACGICGSDLMHWYLKSRAPLVLGHEPTGIVAKTGKNVNQFKKGERVFVHHHVACLACHYCAHGDYTLCEDFAKTNIHPGGLAEYFRVPAPNVQKDTLKIPDNLSFEEATLIEPVACCLKAHTKLIIRPEDTVAIIGAGPSGIIHTILSKNLRPAKIIVSDLINYRLEAAKQFGADLIVNPKNDSLIEKVRDSTRGIGADVIIVTAPNAEAVTEGLKTCRRGGTVCLFAPTPPSTQVSVSPRRLFFSEIRIVPSYSTSHIETRTALKLISSGKIKAKELITHRLPLSETSEAFKTAAKGECLKVVILNE